MTKITPEAQEVLRISNLLLLGFKIDIDDIPAEVAAHVEYFGMRRRGEEKKADFEQLAKLLGAKR